MAMGVNRMFGTFYWADEHEISAAGIAIST